MDVEQANEWLSEKRRMQNSTKGTSIRYNNKRNENNLQESLTLEPIRSPKSTLDTEAFFENIYGFDDIKSLFRRAISSEKQIHILLVGPPACGKSLFMENLMKLEHSFFTLGSQSTKAGMVHALFERRPRFLVVDEIGEMSEKDQTLLLSLMEGGTISETKYKRSRETNLKTSVFATANSTDNLLVPLLTRFCVLHLKPYSFDEFQEITRLVLSKDGVDVEIANEIAHIVWTKMNSRNIRDCVRLGRMANNSFEDVNLIVSTLVKYDGQL
jgi:MoxR-like ATPase